MSKFKVFIIGSDLLKVGIIEKFLLQENYEVLGKSCDYTNAIHLLDHLKSKIDLVIFELKKTSIRWVEKIISAIKNENQIPFMIVNTDQNIESTGDSPIPLSDVLNKKRFPMAISETIRNFAKRNNTVELSEDLYVFRESFVVKNDRVFHRLRFGEIHFIQEKSDSILIHMDYEIYEISTALSEIEKYLRLPYFIRCNQTCLVNVKHVEKFRDDQLISGNTKIPIGDQYSEKVFRRFKIFKAQDGND